VGAVRASPATALAVGLLATAWSAPTAGATSADERLVAYLALVERYRAGDSDAVEALLGWRPKDVGSAVAEIEDRHDDVVPEEDRPGAIDVLTLEAAALLHAQAALALPGEDDIRGHLQLAESLLELAEEAARRTDAGDRGPPEGRPPDRAVTRLEFDTAVAGLLLLKGQPALALRTAERGLDIAPRDGRLLLTAGCAHEQYCLLEGQSLDVPFLAPPRPSVRLLRDTDRQRRSERLEAERRRAASLMAEALLAEPDLHAARLRLGRLRAQQGDAEGAERLLREVATGSDRETRYLAEMFLGSLAEERSDLAGAEARFRRSLLTVPQSQAARLALARVLSLSGRGDAARTLVLETLSAAWPRDLAADPWWLYPFGPGPEAQRLFLELVARVRAR